MPMRRTVLLLALLLLGNATASGSVTVNAGVLQEELKVALEQRVMTHEGFDVYVGLQTHATPDKLELAKPYVLACRDVNAGFAYASACGEFAYPVVGQDSLLRVFLTVAW